ncbi:protein WHAT'S THIS FACTOR 1, chloroplastic [Cornus florida]|uniref:protein WHAT'S THIS FACTOR 1, chloroplastic n=1 Tax=Cornus florida TaxID=4283 RepID=UPI0028995E7A|nr:protein WHAT'S THIS FACTOR 1, chloroplastic [Cornus florida]XP_059631341.1 protein WHAT'S THIS FACTOR 1, chloroplastic [Cornus florida]XP_059631342.1 protein WHAT'S THIS FACTOR 1, chloroplastic [Cornus florida]XP_059631343.1 protein WHAT'S THIS FACTOR 1, chloroplastic [Cornus florida]XP_059631344.1 protein WHAT'S THIS FACTOR 1, chloroplastic [Cornus florida]XP_059631345.1 protein WHAT'S THIS FACTOR 1, chloroplastic [Cornus florida]
MAWRIIFTTSKSKPSFSQTLIIPKTLTSHPNPNIFAAPFSTSFLITKTPKKFKKKRKKDSPRTKLVQHQSNLIPHFETILNRDTHFRFLTKTKEFLSKQPEHVLRLDDAGKLHRELGFPRGRKVLRSIQRHPLLLDTYRHDDGKMWFGFTDSMEDLLQQEREIMDSMEVDRVNTVRKLLMISANKRIPLSKIYHCRLLFGIPEDFRDRVVKYPNYFNIVVENDGKRVLELVNWDASLAVSALEREFMVDEDRVKKAFKFPIKHGKSLDLEEGDARKLNLLNTLPLVSPYSDGSKLDLWTLEAEKYRVGLLHEFLSLTLEKRASIHHIVEFKEEFSLTKHTYQMLLKQPQTFYLAGTEMNWVVFLRDAYDEDGVLINKDPQVVFNEKLYRYAQMQELDSGSDVVTR